MKYRWIVYFIVLLLIPMAALYVLHKDTSSAHDSLSCACAGSVDCSQYENQECCNHEVKHGSISEH